MLDFAKSKLQLHISRNGFHEVCFCYFINYETFLGKGPKFQSLNQSKTRKYCFLASDWLKFGALPRKHPGTLSCLNFVNFSRYHKIKTKITLIPDKTRR